MGHQLPCTMLCACGGGCRPTCLNAFNIGDTDEPVSEDVDTDDDDNDDKDVEDDSNDEEDNV